jgi:heptosyltransferase-3
VTTRLIIRPGAIGDFIVAMPAMESLRAGYLEVWAASPNLPLAGFADGARAIASTGIDLVGITEPPGGLIERLRGFDSIVSWYGANRPEFRELVGSLGLRFQFLDALPPADCRMHAADFYLRQVAGLASKLADPMPRIPVPTCPRAGAILHPFSGSARKNWPLERFRELARSLAEVLPVEWCAGPEEELPGAIRIQNLYDLACRLAGAAVYIGNDSGIAHLAAAVGTPVVALFGPSDPRVWAPRGERVRVVAAADLAAISVTDVGAAVASLIK